MRATLFDRLARRATPGLKLAAAAALVGLGFAGGLVAAETPARSRVHAVLSEPLPNVAGKTLTAAVVDYPPGASSPSHHHAGSVFVYVLSGEIRSGLNGAEPRVYHAGEAFFEAPGSTHSVSANASATEPASLLAVFVADPGAKLTTFDAQ